MIDVLLVVGLVVGSVAGLFVVAVLVAWCDGRSQR